MKKLTGYKVISKAHVLKRNRKPQTGRERRTKEEMQMDGIETPPTKQEKKNGSTLYSNNDFERFRELRKCKTIFENSF